MSGRRVLDLVSLAKASRAVGRQHLSLQKQRFNVFSKSSALAKGVEAQTSRLTLTLQAATVLAQRFSGPDITEADPSSQVRTQRGSGSGSGNEIPSHESVEGASSKARPKQGLEQDHHYERSGKNSTAQNLQTGEIDVAQKRSQNSPLPDGTIPPPGSPVAKETNKPDVFSEAEPSAPAKQPLDKEDKHDSLAPEASNRSSIPNPTRASMHNEQSTLDNTDSIAKSTPVPTSQAVPEQEQTSDAMISELFHSTKVSRMLQNKPKGKSPWDEITLQRPAEASPRPLKGKSDQDEDSYNTRASMPNTASEKTGERQDTQDLMKDLSRESPSVAEPPISILDDAVQPTDAYKMQESRVPSTRFGRLWQYGGLATSMAFGAVGEGFRRATGSDSSGSGSLMWSNANMEKLVAKLSRMRGAALKLGQIISFQDSKMLPPAIHQVLQRVQDSADYMPASQRDKVLENNLGSGWRDLFSSFDDIPMAAASIGQVHGAVMKSTGMPVAVKVQYPGVSSSIDSDLSNLSVLLTASRLLPKGLFLGKTIENARTEFAWECDYIREADAARRFRTLLQDEEGTYTVPKIVDEASASQVLTMERMHGIAVTKIPNFTQEKKDWVGTRILRLCLREICDFRYMQTDPNWTNFLYNEQTRKLELLDFGASRDFPVEFVQLYIGVLRAASCNDKATIKDLSIRLGYLTGHESKKMVDAHIASVITLAEPFTDSAPDIYDFRDQTITDRVRALIPIIIRERLAPPPEETYSLHRKLSGAFLLCARLGSRVRAKEMFSKAMEEYNKH